MNETRRGAWLFVAVGGPALWIGGVHEWMVVAFGLVVLALWTQTCERSADALRLPWGALIGAFTATLVALQWIPWAPLRSLDPTTAGAVDEVMGLANAAPWPGMSVTPGDTAVEAGRVIALTVLFVAAAQLSWRWSAAAVVVTATAAAVIAFAHDIAGATAIYGVYTPDHAGALAGPALRVPFVNANHQASLLLLGLFVAGALAIDQRIAARRSPDPDAYDLHRNRLWLTVGAMLILLPALLLTLSRGALVALVLVGPFALALGLRRPTGRRRRRRWRKPSRRAWVALAGIAGLVAVVAQHGAWAELRTLGDIGDPHSSAARKVALAGEALQLVDWSRPLGIGRGAARDLFGAIESDPGAVWFVHIESMPITLVVELGWLAGTAIVVALGLWWLDAFVSTRHHIDARARRIALLGLAALALHNGLEFSLELLGVAAPAVALAGGLSGRARLVLVRRMRWGVAASLAAGLAIAAWGVPRATSGRFEREAAVLRGTIAVADELRLRPLDGRLHGLLARRAAIAGDWTTAGQWARWAIQQRPGAPDPWLLRAAVRRELDSRQAADAAMTDALAHLRRPPDDALVEYLLAQFPQPADLAAVCVDAPGWATLAAVLRAPAPAHADAIAAARIARAPDDVDALRLRTAIAAAAGRPALALHHARLWRAAAPASAASHLAVARVLRRFDPPRLDEARDALDTALAVDLPPPERGAVEEELVRLLIARGDPASIERAREVAVTLRTRPADRATDRRRARLVRDLRDLQ